MAFENVDFKNGGYVAAVAALHEGANISLTLPNLEDWMKIIYFYFKFNLIICIHEIKLTTKFFLFFNT